MGFTVIEDNLVNFPSFICIDTFAMDIGNNGIRS
jgi:hypothetical protein